MFSSRYLIVVFVYVFFNSLCPAGLIGRSYPDGKVTEIIQVDDGANFRCRISGKSLIAGPALRVHVRGINSLKDKTLSKSFVETAFKDARNIRLTNVRLRNYFRIIADVAIDGNDLAGELIKQGFAKTAKVPPPSSVETKTAAYSKMRSERLNGKTVRPGETGNFDKKTTRKNSPGSSTLRISDSLKNSPRSLGGQSFHRDMTFEEAIDQIRHSVDPPLPIVVLWPEIERNCHVQRDTPIGIEWNGKITIKKGLDILLMAVARRNASRLQYYVDGGLITIASTKVNFNKRVMRVYNVAELTAALPQMNYSRGGYGNQGRYGNQGGYRNQGGYENQGRYGNQDRHGNSGRYGNSGRFGNRLNNNSRNQRNSRYNRNNRNNRNRNSSMRR
jgi:hypothetical protein